MRYRARSARSAGSIHGILTTAEQACAGESDIYPRLHGGRWGDARLGRMTSS